MISTEGNAFQEGNAELHFSPARLFYASRAGIRANFHIIVQTRTGPRACFRLLLIFIF